MIEPFQNMPQICFKVLASEVLNVKSRSYQIVKKISFASFPVHLAEARHCTFSSPSSPPLPSTPHHHLLFHLILLPPHLSSSSSYSCPHIHNLFTPSSSFFSSTFSLPCKLGSSDESGSLYLYKGLLHFPALCHQWFYLICFIIILRIAL